MFKSVSAGIVAFALFFVANSASTSAATLDIPTSNGENSAAVQLVNIVEEDKEENAKEEVEKKEKKTIHVVEQNESLSDIAKIYGTTWQRLYDKNDSVELPDIINKGDKIVVPEDDEELEARELPVIAPVPVPVTTTRQVQQTRSTTAVQESAVSSPRASSAGNGYVYGYCTWHVKQLRSDLPNNLGNADSWASNARAQGFATGSTPRVGAVAQATTGYMHVAYVTGVNKDGTITISEMNFKGWGVVNSRTAPANQFTYIY